MMKSSFAVGVYLLLSLSTISVVAAVLPADIMQPNPSPYQVKYKDGTMSPFIQIKVRGKIKSNPEIYEETVDGYTVTPFKGKYIYLDIDKNNGNLVNTGLIAGRDDPYSFNVRKHAAKVRHTILKRNQQLHPSETNYGDYDNQNNIERDGGSNKILTISNFDGVLKNLVIPIRFSDHTNRNLPSQSDLNVLMNNDGPHNLCPTGSVRDVYTKNSFNQFDVQSTVLDWITIDYSEEFCSNGQYGVHRQMHICLADALDKVVASGVDFRDFDLDMDGNIDGITFFHSSYAAEWGGIDQYGTSAINRVWSHKWSLWSRTWEHNGVRVYDYNMNPAIWGRTGSHIGRIGVIAHELGHYLGLPDLYDSDGGGGIGSYGLMANSWGFDGTQYFPPHMSAWSKYQLGWVDPLVVDTPISIYLRQACDYPDMIMITKGYPSGEYLLIENRQPCGFDTKMPQGGLVIFHIVNDASNVAGFPHQAGWPYNGNHYSVAVLQADGFYDLEKGQNRGDRYDVFHANNAKSIGPNGISGVKTAPYPNTKSYKNGNIIDSEVSISDISVSAASMTLDISFESISPVATPVATPVAAPVAAPVATPAVSALTCIDSPLRFKVDVDGNGKGRFKYCSWVASLPSERCILYGVSSTCPFTCNSCSSCADSSLKFKVSINGKDRTKQCKWASKRPKNRCAMEYVSDTCRSTCGSC
jgi:M6 family metalloprotease-like protein